MISKSIMSTIVVAISFIAGLFHLYTGGIGSISSMAQTSIHWLFMSILVFLIYPKKKEKLNLFDISFAAVALVSSLYIVMTWKNRVDRISSALNPLELLIGFLLIVVVLEAARRSSGSVLAITALIFLCYAKVGPYMPGILFHKGYSVSRIVSFISFSENGIFGSALNISSTFIVLFVLFGAFLNGCNGGKLFIDIAYSLTGWARGGPAKTAILSSMLMGCISGSPVANVVTTGTFTIPLMKRAGYESHEACAVEAVASTGGMIMPPVMGAAAFIMAEYLNISYGKVMTAALIPAVLYYMSLFFMVDFVSLKKRLLGMPKSDLPPIRRTMRQSFHLFIPIAGLIYFLIAGWSPMKTVFWAITVLVVIACMRKSTRMSLKGVIEAISDGIISTIPVAVACAAAGIIVGVVGLTGLGVKFSSSLMALSGGSQILGLVYTMFASLVLGCGLPATAVYIILASIAAPALVQMGITPLAAHLFVFYFGIISTITPPVALTAFAAAGIGDANPTKVGGTAFAYGIAAYIVPYMFVFSPSLLMEGDVIGIFIAIITSLFGVYVISSGVVGYFKCNLKLYERIIMFISGIMLVKPGIYTDIAGLMLFFIIVIISKKRSQKQFIHN